MGRRLNCCQNRQGQDGGRQRPTPLNWRDIHCWVQLPMASWPQQKKKQPFWTQMDAAHAIWQSGISFHVITELNSSKHFKESIHSSGRESSPPVRHPERWRRVVLKVTSTGFLQPWLKSLTRKADVTIANVKLALHLVERFPSSVGTPPQMLWGCLVPAIVALWENLAPPTFWILPHANVLQEEDFRTTRRQK